MQNRTVKINAWNCPAPLSLTATDNYSLIVSFNDGVTVDFDFKPYFQYKVFEKLKNKELFKKAILDRWAVIWNDDLDIAIEAVYEKGKLIDNDN